MSSYTVIVQPEAEQDLEQAYNYLEQQAEELGFDFLAEVAHVIELLEEMPLLFPKVYRDLRQAVVGRFQYNIIYKVEHSTVFILAIIHGKRDPGSWQK